MTKKVFESALPAISLLKDRISSKDFVDCFAVASSIPPRQAANIVVDFPAWARLLLQLRKVVVTPFGLLHDGPDEKDKIGLFPVESESQNEIIAGFNDKHLDFRVSVVSYEDTVYLATWVHPHNLGGRLYLSMILPFHILIARNALVRVAAQG